MESVEALLWATASSHDDEDQYPVSNTSVEAQFLITSVAIFCTKIY